MSVTAAPQKYETSDYEPAGLSGVCSLTFTCLLDILLQCFIKIDTIKIYKVYKTMEIDPSIFPHMDLEISLVLFSK